MSNQIDFSAMEVGGSVELAHGPWEGVPRQQYEDAQAYSRETGAQFQVDSEWLMNKQRGMQEQLFKITRLR